MGGLHGGGVERHVVDCVGQVVGVDGCAVRGCGEPCVDGADMEAVLPDAGEGVRQFVGLLAVVVDVRGCGCWGGCGVWVVVWRVGAGGEFVVRVADMEDVLVDGGVCGGGWGCVVRGVVVDAGCGGEGFGGSGEINGAKLFLILHVVTQKHPSLRNIRNKWQIFLA